MKGLRLLPMQMHMQRFMTYEKWERCGKGGVLYYIILPRPVPVRLRQD